MKILVVNCGSSSLKYQLIDMDDEKVLAKGNFERIGEKEAFVTHKVNGEKYVIKSPVMNHEEALKIVLEQLTHKDSLRTNAGLSASTATRTSNDSCLDIFSPRQ